MVSITSELAEEGPLGPAVPVPERVQRVDLPGEVGEPIDERLAVHPPQMLLGGESGEQVVGVGGDVLGQAEQAGFGDRDGAQLARPPVEVTEDGAVERLHVPEVVAAGDAPAGQLGQGIGGDLGLHRGQFGLGANTAVVPQHRGAWVYVWVFDHAGGSRPSPRTQRSRTALARGPGSSPSVRTDPSASATACRRLICMSSIVSYRPPWATPRVDSPEMRARVVSLTHRRMRA